MPITHIIYLTPFFADSHATHIEAVLILKAPNIKAGKALWEYETIFGNVPSYKYEGNLVASDRSGPLPIIRRQDDKDPTVEQWRASRDTDGDVTLTLHARPRDVDINTPTGPRSDLRCDQGGLIGGVRSFLPRPDGSDTYRFVVEWDLSNAPGGTRAVWSYGEGPEPVVKEGPIGMLWNTVLMVGPINSSPPAFAQGSERECSTYWFGTLPPYLDAVKDFPRELFVCAAPFFEAEHDNYSVFVRKVVRGFGGTSFEASYVLEYSEDAASKSDCVLVNLLTHEMVHTWAFIGGEEDGSQNSWFLEGIAQFYALYLPVRFGLRGVDYFIETLNGFLSAYYTNPKINISMDEAESTFYADFYAESISYMRGFVYLLVQDALLTDSRPPTDARGNALDTIVLDFARRQRRGEVVTSKDWLEALYPWVGKERADTEYRNMLAGETIDLSGIATSLTTLGMPLKLERVEQEIFEVGFDPLTMNSRVVTGLRAGSRAELAGLQNGDKLIKTSSVWECRDRMDKNFSFVVERDGERVHREFWPRSFQTASSFQCTLDV
ncbi:hypothetical protein B0T16DRAFT_383627 [Cercophora newfieldiana]|uniref:Peptidase M61 catalytic domain-containing protein n=1 Tax=Cercophora newfieldiana TaxID=92897 RepID=A0AA39XUX3_9PEZI|nr:hypothetical protein B0T16DRAFT_383627 [Cercophora newfieldiana]